MHTREEFKEAMAGVLLLNKRAATVERAREKAEAMLCEFLALDHIEFGDSAYDWTDAGAAEVVHSFDYA